MASPSYVVGRRPRPRFRADLGVLWGAAAPALGPGIFTHPHDAARGGAVPADILSAGKGEEFRRERVYYVR